MKRLWVYRVTARVLLLEPSFFLRHIKFMKQPRFTHNSNFTCHLALLPFDYFTPFIPLVGFFLFLMFSLNRDTALECHQLGCHLITLQLPASETDLLDTTLEIYTLDPTTSTL